MMDSVTIIVVGLMALLAWVLIEHALKYKSDLRHKKFEPEEIGDLTVEKGDMLECTESYGDFTKGFNYIVRVEFGGALVVWNDEKKPVLASGLDPRKFKVVAHNVDGTT